jgi:hypothetical protein
VGRDRGRQRADHLAADTVVVRASDALSGDFGTEAVVLNLGDGVYYGLDDVGARVWALLKQPMTLAALRDAVVAEFDVTPERCERDLQEFLGDLVGRGLARVVPRDDVA